MFGSGLSLGRVWIWFGSCLNLAWIWFWVRFWICSCSCLSRVWVLFWRGLGLTNSGLDMVLVLLRSCWGLVRVVVGSGLGIVSGYGLGLI